MRGAELRVQLPASLESVDRLCDAFCQWTGRPEDQRAAFACDLLLREALANAVLHGAHETGSFVCVLRSNRKRLLIAVSDPGGGFDWRSARRVRADGEKETGRGLAIYRHYANQVRFNTKGNSVALVKRFAAEAKERTSMITRNDTQATVCPEGDVVASSVAALRIAMRELASTGVRTLVLDLTNVKMMDSAGLGLLIAGHNSMRKEGGELSVVNASPEILELLTTMRMTQHFRVNAA